MNESQIMAIVDEALLKGLNRDFQPTGERREFFV
jgi:hypothetical protein